MDKKGVQLGGGRKGSNKRYIFSRHQKSRYRAKSNNLELMAVIDCVCATGNAEIPPGFVHQKGYAGEWWEIPGVGSVSETENGLTDNLVGTHWFENVFIPHAKERNKTPGSRILLIFDGHGSHTNNELIDIAFEHEILLLFLPPHTMHKLQPLDVYVFGPLQRLWAARAEDLAASGHPITRETAIGVYMEVRAQAMKKSTILEGWRQSGIYPFNPAIFTDEDFAPSIATSIIATLPSSYPLPVPSSPIKLSGSEYSTDNDYHDDYDSFPPTDADESDLNDNRAITISDSSDAHHREENDPAEDGDEGSGLDRFFGESDDDEATGSNAPAGQLSRVSSSSLPLPSIAARHRFPHLSSLRTKAPRNTYRAPISEPSSSSGYLTRSTSISSGVSISVSNRPPSRIAGGSGQQQGEIDRLQSRVRILKANLSGAEAHCTLMAAENAHLREVNQVLQTNKGKTKRANIHTITKARSLTLPEAKSGWDAEKLRRANADAEETAKQLEKDTQAKDRERQHRIAYASRTFEHTLGWWKNSAKKDDLKDLANALDLDLDGNKTDLFNKILEHFDTHPELKENPRFSTLFTTARGAKLLRYDELTIYEPMPYALCSHYVVLTLS